MSITRWEPFRDLISLREAMDRLFEESWVRPRAGWLLPTEETLAIDMYETPDSLVVKTAVPGVKLEDIGITITGNSLTYRRRDQGRGEGGGGELYPSRAAAGPFLPFRNLA